MARGIRDLRDMICVSRLTMREESDEEIDFDTDAERELTSSVESLSLSSETDSRESSAKSRGGSGKLPSPDSGIGTNGEPSLEVKSVSSESSSVMGADSLTQFVIPPRPPNVDKPTAARKRRKRRRRPLQTIPPKHELSKSSPLPPVSRSSELIGKISDNEAAFDGNFDHILTYVDGTILSEWLLQANKQVSDIASWCHTGDNFVNFAHFWLSEFPDAQRYDIFKLEQGIVLEQLGLVFAAGRDSGAVKYKDLTRLMQAVFKEFPKRLLNSRGPYLFLDHLDVLSSERQSAYKKLLTDVLCSTRIKQHAQWVLAIRSFTLVSVWYAVLNFYRKLMSHTGPPSAGLPIPLALIAKNKPEVQRMYQAIRNGYTDVINYLLVTGKVDAQFTDSHDKTLLFTAVVQNQPKVAQFFLQRKSRPDVNKAADTGNTPLHAAANNGNVEMVQLLLEAPGIQVDPINKQCEGATPLLLAIMHGHTKVAECLLKAKANRSAKMGDLGLMDLAQDFGHEDIVKLLSRY